MSLSSSIRSIYRKPHQNQTISSRVIEGQTHIQTYIYYYYTSGFAASRVQSEAYMDCRPPVLAPSALGNRPPVQNWIEEKQGSVFFRSLTVSEAPYLRVLTPKIRIPL